MYPGLQQTELRIVRQNVNKVKLETFTLGPHLLETRSQLKSSRAQFNQRKRAFWYESKVK